MHLHGGQTCQINTRGYFCNIQQASAVHQTALAAYFRWQRFIHFSWTIKSLALFGYAHLLRWIFPLKHFAEDGFPNGDHQSHFYQPTSELPAHVPKAGSSRGVRLPGYQGVLWAHNLGISALLHLAQPCVVLSVRLFSWSQKKLTSSGSGMRPLGPNRIIWLVHRCTFDQQPYFYSLSFLFLIIIVNSFNLHKQLPFQFSCKNSHSHYISCNLRKMKSCPFFLHYLPLSPVKHFLSHTQPSPWHLSNRAQLSSLAISPFQRGHCPLISSSCTSSAVIFPQLETGCYLSCSFFFFSSSFPSMLLSLFLKTTCPKAGIFAVGVVGAGSHECDVQPAVSWRAVLCLGWP